MEKILFSEEQRFTQKWLWILIIGVALLTTIPAFYKILSAENYERVESDSFPLILLVTELVFMGGIILLFLKMRLIVEIKSDGIWFRFPPLLGKWKSIMKDDIVGFEIRTYRPVLEYGGWGIKGSTRNKAYNVKGNVGLQLYLKNGKKILFGTQQNHAIEYALKKLMKEELQE